MWNKTPSIPWKRKLTPSQHRAVYSKSLPLPVGGAVSCLPQKRRHLFIVTSHEWEQLVDVYCGDLRAVYQKASTGETQSTWSSGEIFIGNGGAPTESVPPAVPAVPRFNFTWDFWFRYDLKTRLCNADLWPWGVNRRTGVPGRKKYWNIYITVSCS